MTATATVARLLAAPPTLPVAASTAVAGVLTGRPGRGVVVAVGSVAAYVDVAGDLVAVAAPAASRVPCAVRLGSAAPPPGEFCAPGDEALVGDRAVVLPGASLRVARWWDPAPALAPIATADLAAWRAAVGSLVGAGVPGLADDPPAAAAVSALSEALAARAADAAVAAAARLIGRGSGSTPAGDDVLAGAVVGARLLAARLTGSAAATAAAVWRGPGAALARLVVEAAPGRTTVLSAALLRQAAAGHPLGELADLLRTAAGRDPAPALARLVAVGHTSGRDLLAGLLAAADAALTGNEVRR